MDQIIQSVKFFELRAFFEAYTNFYSQTVSLETGMQNVGLAILVLKSSLPEPDSDLAIIPPIAAIMMTTLPFYIITPIYLIRQRILKRVCMNFHEKI